MFDFLKGKQKPPLHKIETVIGSNTSFEGHLKCDGNIRIDGVCAGGTIETVGNVVVAPGGRVSARIIAEHVSVAGEVSGSIHARGILEILSTGRVSGDVHVANFFKDEQGVLSGRLVMGAEAAAEAIVDGEMDQGSAATGVSAADEMIADRDGEMAELG